MHFLSHSSRVKFIDRCRFTSINSLNIDVKSTPAKDKIMTTNLKASPSFLLGLINSSRGLNDIKATRLFNSLNLEKSAILTKEDVEDAERLVSEASVFDEDVVENLSQNLSSDEETKGGVVPPSDEGDDVFRDALRSEEIANYMQSILENNSNISIWATDVLPILDILQRSALAGKTITPKVILNTMKFYHKGDSETDEILKMLERGETITPDKFNEIELNKNDPKAAPAASPSPTQPESDVFGDTRGLPDQSLSDNIDWSQRGKELGVSSALSRTMILKAR